MQVRALVRTLLGLDKTYSFVARARINSRIACPYCWLIAAHPSTAPADERRRFRCMVCLNLGLAITPSSGDTHTMSRPRRPGPSPDGRHDDLPPDQWRELSLDVPDDPRALDADRQQWLREVSESPEAAPLFGKPRRSRPARSGQRLVITAAVLLVSLVVVAVSGLLASLALVPATQGPTPAPLAADVESVGKVGGLLPVVSLSEANPLADTSTPVAAQSLRPAVIALVPDDCADCAALLRAVAGQASQYQIPLTLIGPTSQGEQLTTLAAELGTFRLDVLTDSSGDFRDTFGNAQPTLVLVREDGVIVDVVRGAQEGDRLESALVQLVPSLGSAN